MSFVTTFRQLFISFIVVLLQAFTFCLSAQSPIENDLSKETFFQHYTNADGMVSNHAFKIFQGSKGFLWLCTDDGVDRFDGYEFKHYRPDPENLQAISHGKVMDGFESADGVLWFGTNGGGVNIFDRKTETFSVLRHRTGDPNSLVNDAVYAICEDKNGHMWFGSYGGGVSRYDRSTGVFVNYQANDKDVFSLSGNSIRDIVIDDNQNIWIGVDGGGLCRYDYDKDRFTRFRHNPADRKTIGSDIVLDIEKDKTGRLWISSWEGGISYFDPTTGRNLKHFKHNPDNPHSLNNNISFSMAVDDENRLWVATWKGLNMYDDDTGRFTHFENDPLVSTSLLSNSLMAVCFDRFGCLWVSGKGLNKIDLKRTQFHTFRKEYNNKNSLTDNRVRSMLYHKNKWYFGTRKGGLNIADFKRNSYRQMHHDPENSNSLIADYKLDCMAFDKQGNLYIGSNGKGLSIYNTFTGLFTNLTEQPGDLAKLHNNSPKALFLDSKGVMWIGFYGGGFQSYDPLKKTFKQYHIDQVDKQRDVVVDFVEDEQGRLWIATIGHGLAMLDESRNKLQFFDPELGNENTVSNDAINDICLGTNNRLWIGTYGGGLNCLDLKTLQFERYNEKKDNLGSDKIEALIQHGSELWIASNKGLCRFDIIKRKVIHNYDETDGLQDNVFRGRCVATDGVNIIFGGPQGFTAFVPDSIIQNEQEPEVVITDITINNAPVAIGADSALRVAPAEAKELFLSPEHKSFTVHFSVMHFAVPEKNKFKYMLEGFDNDWIETTPSKRFASYTNLSGGDYVFKVIGTNADGVWNNTGAELVIHVSPPFFKTTWFYVCIAIVFGAMVVFYVRMNKKRVKEINRKLQLKIDEAVDKAENQTREIERQHEELQFQQEEERKRNWVNTGISDFAEVMQVESADIKDLGYSVLSKLVKYVDAAQGGVFVLNDDDKNKPFLELIASYAYSEQRMDNKKIEIGENLVGACFKDGQTKFLKNLPQGYTTLESSLGNCSPVLLMIVPLIYNDKKQGVMELSFYIEPEQYKLDFIEELSKSFAGQLATLRFHYVTSRLLGKTTRQAKQFEEQAKEAKMMAEAFERKLLELTNQSKETEVKVEN